MSYTEKEVLDIIKSCTNKNPENVLNKWNENKANTPIDLKEWNYPYFIYSFPININGDLVGKITLVDDASMGSKTREDLIQKFLGSEDYNYTGSSFSHSTYHWCYVTIYKSFELSKIIPGFHGDTFKGVDAEGEEFDFRISYGTPIKDKESHYAIFKQYRDDYDGYKLYWFDGFNVQIRGLKNGWSLGEKVNENINNRINLNKDKDE